MRALALAPSTPDERRDAEQQRAAELLGRGFSQPEVARLVGRSARTIRNWQRDVAGFREAVPAARAETSDPTALARVRVRSLTVPTVAVIPSRARREPAPVDRIATCRAPSTGTVTQASHFPQTATATRAETSREWTH